VEAIKKVNRITSYSGKDGISTFCSHLGITKAIKNEDIIFGATGDHHLSNFICFIKGSVIDLSKSPNFNHVIDELYDTILHHFPSSEWKRVNKISLSDPNGGQIEYTSSTANSIRAWIRPFYKKGNLCTQQQFLLLLQDFEKHITQCISQFAFQWNGHVVCLQPGALRSMPATVPQLPHRDFITSMYRDQFPNQLFIGFMPITQDGMFLQVWNGPGPAKLVYIPYGYFLLLPGDTVHAGWMCTSPEKYNYCIHFYILVSQEIGHLSRKESYIFENMNQYIDEESTTKEELCLSHYNALPDFKHFIE
jgi:hypothetical protein